MMTLSHYIGLLLALAVVLVLLVAGIGKWRQVRARESQLRAALPTEPFVSPVKPNSSGGKGEER